MEALFLDSISVPSPIRRNARSYYCTRSANWYFSSHCNVSTASRNNKLKPACCLNSENARSVKALPSHVEGLSYVLTKEEMMTLNNVAERDTTSKFMEKVSSDGIGIVKCFSGKVLFITGATGFLAKVLVEKILRTIPDVGKIYLLIQAKDNEAALDRLKNEIINKELFKCLQQTDGRFNQAFMLNKLIPVAGNVCESNDLGIHPSLVNEIASKVDIIINSAATTTFDERYDVALDINTKGPSRLLSFAKKCNKLRLFMHVSTAYVNGKREGRILEKPFSIGDNLAKEIARKSKTHSISYQMLDIEAELKMALNARESFGDDEVTQKMKEMGLERARTFGWDDTYEFTKAMGEMLLNKTRGDTPVIIVRPSIIEGTYKEPNPGWIEGFRMLDPLILWHGRGRLTGFPIDANGVFDVVPADMVVNAMLAAGASRLSSARLKSGIEVYHVASSTVNPLGTADVFRFSLEHFRTFPYKDSKGMPTHIEKLKLFNSIEDFNSYIEQVGEASNGSTSQRFKKKLAEQSKHMAKMYQPYTFYKGRFDNTNTQKLIDKMSEEEKKSFGFDVRSIDWKDYICYTHLPGLRRNVLMGR
ncbi:hypothetical protein Sjap_000836 [Stephania japonica]|uniref:Fatty acyl-CoA reductase n=1 Tax=Stephania japonica TaxID=461633 RepID=A0AAP0PUG5_9MAGN